MSNRSEINTCKLLHRKRRFLAFSPEPAWRNLCIRLRHSPLISIRKSFRISVSVTIDRIILSVDCWLCPRFFSRISSLISDPSYSCIRFRAEKKAIILVLSACFSLVLLNCLKPSLEIIILRIALVVRIFCAVHPNFFKMTVVSVLIISKNLFQLIIIVFVIIKSVFLFYLIPCFSIQRLSVSSDKFFSILIFVTIIFTIYIPRGKIQSHVNIIFCTRSGKFF